MSNPTEKQRRAMRAAAFNIRKALQSAIDAGLSESILDRLRALSLEIGTEQLRTEEQ